MTRAFRGKEVGRKGESYTYETLGNQGRKGEERKKERKGERGNGVRGKLQEYYKEKENIWKDER